MNRFRLTAFVLNASIVVVKYDSKSRPVYGVARWR